MKRIIKYLSIIVALLFVFTINVKAENYKVYVDLDTLEYSINDKDYSSITEYNTLEEFLKVQKRFAHLFKPGNEWMIQELQEEIDKRWEELLELEEITNNN